MPNHPPISREIADALLVLEAGGVIIFPTETTYGLGGDPRRPETVKRIFRIKGRDPSKPLLLVAGSLAQVEQVARLSPYAKRLVDRYWPGALTLILPVKEKVALVDGVAVSGEVAVRFSSSPTVIRLTRAFGFPIIATSANRSGQSDSRSLEDIRSSGLQVDHIIDGGTLPVHKPSTLARIRSDGSIEVLRQGEVYLPSHV